MQMIGLSFMICHLSFAVSACSESEDEEASEFGTDWQARNEAYFATLQDSLSRSDYRWLKLKSYTKDSSDSGVNTDYIYAKVIESGEGADSPMYTDSVRVSYRGRLIPSASYAEGYVFDQTFVGNFSWQTTAVYGNTAGGWIDGFATALLHMHRGDYWRIYIPHQLAYGSSGSGSSVPGYSTLIFDVALVDFGPSNETFPRWSARQR